MQALGSLYFIHDSLKNIQQFDFKGEPHPTSLHHMTHIHHDHYHPCMPLYHIPAYHMRPFAGYSCFYQKQWAVIGFEDNVKGAGQNGNAYKY